MKNPDLSFVIPIKDEEFTLQELSSEIRAVCKTIKKTFEIIFVDDGSLDKSFLIMKKIKRKYKNIRILRLRGNFGKSVALTLGFSAAKGKIIFTMDGDLQDNPKDIPLFLKQIDHGYDLVSGWKKKRYDPLTKTIPSKIGNYLTRILTGITIHDLNCGFKAYRKEVIQNLNLYGELYKFIPVFAAKQNFKINEVIISHHKRKFGKSKFGWERNTKGFLDLLTVVFLTGFLRRPGHFFGTLGLLCFFAGFLIGIYISYLRLTTGTIQYRQPLLFLGMLLMIVGIQFISTGLLAEMITYTKEKPDYASFIVERLD